MELLEGGGNQEVRPREGSQWGCVLEGHPSSLFFPFLAAMRYAAFLSCPSTVMFLPCHGPKRRGTGQSWPEVSDTLSQSKSFFP